MTISIVTAFIYFARIEMDLYEIIKNKHHVLVDFSGTDNAPFKYRILFPIVSEFLQIFLKLIFNEKISFQLSYIFLNTFSIFAFTTLCFFYFQKYFKNSTSIIGVLLIGILINVHLKQYHENYDLHKF